MQSLRTPSVLLLLALIAAGCASSRPPAVETSAQVMNFFAFPISDGQTLFRVKHGNVRLSGIDVLMETSFLR